MNRKTIFSLGIVEKTIKETKVSNFSKNLMWRLKNYSNFISQKWSFGSKNFKVHESWPSRCHLRAFWKTKLNLYMILLIDNPKSEKIQSKFENLEARKDIRVIHMAFLPQKRTQWFQIFGIFVKFLYLLKVSFLNLCVTDFRLPALHLTSLAKTMGE